MDDTTLTDPDRAHWVFPAALRAALGRPAAWLVAWLATALLAVAPAMLWLRWMPDAIAHRAEPGSLVGNLPAPFLHDFATELGALHEAEAQVGAVLALLAMLVSAFLAGGWLQLFLEGKREQTLQRFLFGGSRCFFRFVRFLVLTLLVLAGLSWLVYGWPWDSWVLEGLVGLPAWDVSGMETLASEWHAVGLRWAQHATFGLLFALVLTWGDYGRTRLALLDGRSAVWAGLCALGTLLRHPLRTLRPMLGLLAVEALVAVGLGLLAQSLDAGLHADGGAWRIVALLAIGQLVLLWRLVTRGARYAAAVEVSRTILSPATPDPWQQSIGGPGGPRYPLDAEDEYGVAL